MWAGAISLRYSVTATDAKATATPSRMRPRMSSAKFGAAAVTTTPTSNRPPASSIVRLRPHFLCAAGGWTAIVERHAR